MWAIEMAEEFPNATVVGTDLSPIQPGWVPTNCSFFVDDFESEWTYHAHEHFDYIHGRSLCGSVADWPRFFAQAYENLKPGGFLEMQEYQTWIFCDDDTYDSVTWLKDWVNQMDEVSEKFGKRMRTAQLHKQWIQEAGFIDVHEEIYKVNTSFPKQLVQTTNPQTGTDRALGKRKEAKRAWDVLSSTVP